MQKKKGISLIALVITIIVMIILASSVVITLSNTGVINKASQAVQLTDEKQVQNVASLIWADAYMDKLRGTELETKVKEELEKYDIKESDWNIIITNSGVTVTKNPFKPGTLGYLITPENYGDTVDYSVTVEGTTYSDWQIYYHNDEYIYLITSEIVGEVELNKGITVASLTSDELALYEKFRVGNWPKCTLADIVNENPSKSSQAVAQLIRDYATFANKQLYGTNVVGAIGGPTIELLAAAWNAKKYTPTMTLTIEEYGYKINGSDTILVTSDELYVPLEYDYWLASPGHNNRLNVYNTGYEGVGSNNYGRARGVRPVVCLKSSIPATIGTTTDFSLVK